RSAGRGPAHRQAGRAGTVSVAAEDPGGGVVILSVSSPGLTGPVFQRRQMGTRSFYIYILASRIGGTLYIGVTNDLIRRVAEHQLKLVQSFTKKCEVARLVYFDKI